MQPRPQWRDPGIDREASGFASRLLAAQVRWVCLLAGPAGGPTSGGPATRSHQGARGKARSIDAQVKRGPATVRAAKRTPQWLDAAVIVEPLRSVPGGPGQRLTSPMYRRRRGGDNTTAGVVRRGAVSTRRTAAGSSDAGSYRRRSHSGVCGDAFMLPIMSCPLSSGVDAPVCESGSASTGLRC